VDHFNRFSPDHSDTSTYSRLQKLRFKHQLLGRSRSRVGRLACGDIDDTRERSGTADEGLTDHIMLQRLEPCQSTLPEVRSVFALPTCLCSLRFTSSTFTYTSRCQHHRSSSGYGLGKRGSNRQTKSVYISSDTPKLNTSKSSISLSGLDHAYVTSAKHDISSACVHTLTDGWLTGSP
jgi:hypothetical protein